MPRIAVLRGMVMNHLVHHRGQLSVYMRLLEIPVPSIYGPTADGACSIHRTSIVSSRGLRANPTT